MTSSLLNIYRSFECLRPIRCPKRVREIEGKDAHHKHPPPHLHHHHHHTGRNHQQLSRSFKWEAIIAIWQLCSFLNGFCFKGADLAPCLALRTLWLFWRGSFVCMPSSSLLRSLSLSLSRHPIPSNCESETNKLDAHWTECDVLPEQRRDRAWGVWGWMRDWRKSEEVDVCVCLLDTPIWPPGWRGLTAEWADWHIDNNPPPPRLPLISLSSFSSLALYCWWYVSAQGLLQLHEQVDGVFLSCNLGMVIRHALFNKKDKHTQRQPRLGTAWENNTLVLGDQTLGAITISIQGEWSPPHWPHQPHFLL